jgi:hypothetical protein
MDAEDQMEVEVEVEEKEKQQSDAKALVVPEVSQLPWIEKYRPKSLSELIAHDEIINICESTVFHGVHSCIIWLWFLLLITTTFLIIFNLSTHHPTHLMYIIVSMLPIQCICLCLLYSVSE